MSDDTVQGLDGRTYTAEFWARWGNDPGFKEGYMDRAVKRFISIFDGVDR